MFYFSSYIAHFSRHTFFFCWCLLLFLFSGFAQINPSKAAISFTGGKLIINKTNVAKAWHLSDLVSVIGKEDRILSGKYNRYIYDGAGLVIMENTSITGSIAEIQFFIDSTDHELYTPESWFAGTFIMENLKITNTSSIESIKISLGDYLEKEMSETGVYRFSKNGLYILLRFDKQNNLQKICVGPAQDAAP